MVKDIRLGKSFKPLYDYIEAKIEPLATTEMVSLLPTKDEFYTKMDEVMGELKAIREEQAIITQKVSDHDDRIEVLEVAVGVAVT